MTKEKVINELKKYSKPENIEGMKRFGIMGSKILGVNIPVLRKLAKDLGTDQKLALALWDSGIHEARILASMIADKEKFNSKLMDKWIKDFDSWDVCDETCLNLFYALPISYKKAEVWARRKPEFERRAGFALMAVLAFKEKKAFDKDFVKFFPLIKKYSTDKRNFVRKAVNWALRQIGKRNIALNKKALNLAYEIQKIDDKTARWVASNAISELTNKKIINRLTRH
jgi:3-methyladenine DNA glycosylase AlkD